MSDVRNKLLITGLLALLLVCFAIGNFVFIKKIDKAYSSIISTDIRRLNTLHALNRENSTIQRCLLNMLLIDDSTEIVKQKEDVYATSKKIDKLLVKLDDMSESRQEGELVKKLANSCLDYRQDCGNFIILMQNCRYSEAIAFLKKEMNPAFIQLQNTQDEFASFIYASSNKNSQAVTDKTNTMGTVTIGVAVVPFIVWIVCAIGLFSYIIWILRKNKLRNLIVPAGGK